MYIATLTTSPSFPIRVYPIPLYSSTRPSAPSSSRVCAYLASVDTLYLSLFFSSAYQHAFDGTSVEAEGAVVLDAIVRYVMDATVSIKLPLGEVNIESAAATAHAQQSGARDREREEKESPHAFPSHPTSSSLAISRAHPAPVQIPPAADLVSAPSLISPNPQLHAVSAPTHDFGKSAADETVNEVDALSVTPPHRTVQSSATAVERKEERERPETAHEREMMTAGRVTLPFVSDVAFLSLSLTRPRTTSDSELHRPPLHLQHSSITTRAAEEQHSIAVHPPEEAQQQYHQRVDSEEGERKGGEHKKSGSVLSSFNKALQSITRTSSAADGGRHTKNSMSTVHLPPSTTLSGSKSDSSRMARLSKRRNSDSQTHYRGESASSAGTHTATSSAQSSSVPADLLRAPLLNRRILLSWFTSGKDKVRRVSVDLNSGAGSGAGGGKMKKSSVKGTFERVLVQRIVDDGSGLQKAKEHKRSFMEQAMHSITHLPSAVTLAAPSPAASATSASSLTAHSTDHSPSASISTSTSGSPMHAASHTVPSLSSNQLLLLARRRPPKESSLLHRLRDDSSHLAKTVSKVIVSAPDHATRFASVAHSTTGNSATSAGVSSVSSHSAVAVSGGVGLVDLGCLVDGVEVLGVSVVSVSAQVSGRVKGLAVQLFSVPSTTSS